MKKIKALLDEKAIDKIPVKDAVGFLYGQPNPTAAQQGQPRHYQMPRGLLAVGQTKRGQL